MNILINNQSVSESNGTTYFSFDAAIENKSVAIMIVSGKSNYVNIRVKNASHKAWKGTGKDFATINEAVNNYKDGKIKAIILAASDIFAPKFIA